MTPRLPDKLLPGSPTPLGATWDGLGINFAVFSAHASMIELCVFDESGRKELARLPLPECTDEVWHGYLPGTEAGLVYGFRAHGPYEPQRGHRFNPHKLLLDPYAKKLLGYVRWADALFGYRLQGARGDLSFDRRDSAPAMAKAIVIDDSFNWGDERAPRTPWADTVIYEAHVRGVSMRREQHLPLERGTLRALADPLFVDHLVKLGITAIELLPVHAFLQDRFLIERGLRNYWGYSTLGFFAPEPTYLAGTMINEFRVAVRRLHAAGIEVILDVVYNHTCEGNELGPTLSWRGLDNASYYKLVPGDERHYINDTGCGNTLNVTHPRVLQMVMDSLRHWVEYYHVDGFRFDLGCALGRESYGFDPNSGFFDAIRQDPVLSKVKMISEPWDLGPGGYQLGNHPPGFAEWNDKYRDATRAYWRGDPGVRGDFAARLSGSADLFDRRRRKAWSSVNFVTAHDGFTLRDVVSYANKHNEANREDNRDGSDNNISANWSEDGAIEGPTDDAAVNATRGRVQRAMLATLLVSQGTPMLLGGDEFGRSQGGNNNAYCQDNTTSWFDWQAAATPAAQALTDYTAALIALRHQLPSLRAVEYLHGQREHAPGVRDMDWFGANGEPMTPDDWNDPQGRCLALRRATHRADGSLEITLLLFNASSEDVSFVLPQPAQRWRLRLDSAAAVAHADADGAHSVHGPHPVPAHGVVLLLAEPRHAAVHGAQLPHAATALLPARAHASSDAAGAPPPAPTDPSS